MMSSKSQKMFTHSVGNGMVCYVEQKVDNFDFNGFEIVAHEMFSNAFPAVKLKNGSAVFNIHAIRMLDECSHIQIFVHPQKKSLIAKSCRKDVDGSLQWSRVDKHGKILPIKITGAAPIYDAMQWDENTNVKMSGALDKCGNEKMVVFHRYN